MEGEIYNEVCLNINPQIRRSEQDLEREIYDAVCLNLVREVTQSKQDFKGDFYNMVLESDLADRAVRGEFGRGNL